MRFAGLAVAALVGCHGGREVIHVPASFEIHGHRGARGLYPENTIEGHTAATHQVDVLETDLLVTKDGEVVLHHDVELNPDTTRDAGGKWLDATGPSVRALTFAELETFDVGRLKPGTAYAKRFPEQRGRDGVRIPRMRDAFAAVERIAAGKSWNVEIKIDEEHPEKTAPVDVAVKAVLDELRATAMTSRVILQSFDWDVVRAVKAAEPKIPTACLSEPKTKSGDVPKLAADAGCTYWEPSFETLTAPQVQEAHRLGLKVVPWTVNEVRDLKSVVLLGVDGVISDRPDRLDH